MLPNFTVADPRNDPNPLPFMVTDDPTVVDVGESELIFGSMFLEVELEVPPSVDTVTSTVFDMPVGTVACISVSVQDA